MYYQPYFYLYSSSLIFYHLIEQVFNYFLAFLLFFENDFQDYLVIIKINRMAQTLILIINNYYISKLPSPCYSFKDLKLYPKKSLA